MVEYLAILHSLWTAQTVRSIVQEREKVGMSLATAGTRRIFRVGMSYAIVVTYDLSYSHSLGIISSTLSHARSAQERYVGLVGQMPVVCLTLLL